VPFFMRCVRAKFTPEAARKREGARVAARLRPGTFAERGGRESRPPSRSAGLAAPADPLVRAAAHGRHPSRSPAAQDNPGRIARTLRIARTTPISIRATVGDVTVTGWDRPRRRRGDRAQQAGAGSGDGRVGGDRERRRGTAHHRYSDRRSEGHATARIDHRPRPGRCAPRRDRSLRRHDGPTPQFARRHPRQRRSRLDRGIDSQRRGPARDQHRQRPPRTRDARRPKG